MNTEKSTQAMALDATASYTEQVQASNELPGAQLAITAELQNSRLEEIAQALIREGACVTLSGEPGSDTINVAHCAAQLLEKMIGAQFKFVLIGDAEDRIPPTADETPSVRRELESLLGHVEHSPGASKVFAIAIDIDRYDHQSAVLLEQLVRSRRVRLICTTHRITGAADRLARNPEVRQHVVAPLTPEQSEKFLSTLLGVSAVAPSLASRWHAITAGNPHALATLALSAERRGIVQRARHTAWIVRQDDEPPVDFIEQLGTLTPLEREVLDLVAYAAPVQEPALFRLLDSATVSSLLARHILTVHTNPDGLSALQTRLPIVGEALRAHLTPLKRVEFAELCFNALSENEGANAQNQGSARRLARFGLDSGNAVEVDSLWRAMRQSMRAGDLPFLLTLSLGAMMHPDPQRSAVAIVWSTALSQFLGNHGALVESLDALDALLSDTNRISQVSFDTQTDLVSMWARCHPNLRTNPSAALAQYDVWAERWVAQGFEPKNVIQSCKVRSLALAGSAREAFAAAKYVIDPRSLGDDSHSTSARTFEAYLHIQRGEFRTAIQHAENARLIMMLNDPAPSSFGDHEGFVRFLANWARGSTHSTRESLEEYGTSRGDVRAAHEHTRAVDLSIILFAIQEGRWTEAAELVSPLIERLSKNDPFGLMEFAQASAALIFATLGDRGKAYTALKLSSTPPPGLSRMLHGLVGILSLRALHWLRDPAIKKQARSLADWAAREDLPLIELEALDIFAFEAGVSGRDILHRAAAIAEAIDQPIGETLLAHIRALTDAAPEMFMPEERLLSELGVWLPLPPTESLTGREREIALFTSVGYSSKQIGERLHLSARTVETHLARIYSKLSITSREDLRKWFARTRDHQG